MKLSLERATGGKIQTAIIGQLSINDLPFCYTEERRGVEIPLGTYPVEMTFSPHFQRMMPLLGGVAGRTAIRIHPGNVPTDSEGCILVGETHTDHSLGDSRHASDTLNEKITAALANGETVSITLL